MSVNKFIAIGYVVKDPETRTFDNGGQVSSFTLALNERGYTLPNGTVVPDRTEFANIVVWRGLAKIAEQYIRKGGLVYIEGKIRTRTYDDKNNIKRYVTEIYADSLELLGRKKDEESDPSQPSYTEQAPPPSQEDDLPF